MVCVSAACGSTRDERKPSHAHPNHLVQTASQAVALVSAGGDSALSLVGLAVGLATSAVMFYICVRRTIDLEYNDGDWPGGFPWVVFGG
jgi:hypothetical protein